MKTFKAVVIVALLLAASLTWAKGPAGVAVGLHNLSATGADPNAGWVPGSSIYATDEDAICVFCHTPHSGSLDGPLWNRSNPSSAWQHYNSATMSAELALLSVSRAPNDESLLCLSCHDGSISVNHLINAPNDRTAPITTTFGGDPDMEIIDLFGVTPGSRIGGSVANTGDTGDFRDDHPFSFSYTTVETSAEYQPGGAKSGQLQDTATAVTNGVRFFGVDNNVECSTCHDPHVNYRDNPEYGPFLIMSNSGSGLCLACHIK